MQRYLILQGIYKAARGVYEHLMASEEFKDLASKPVRGTSYIDLRCTQFWLQIMLTVHKI